MMYFVTWTQVIMQQLSPILGKMAGELIHWCAGCNHFHMIHINSENDCGARWSWNGDAEQPTIKNREGEDNLRSIKILNAKGEVICHYTIEKGFISYDDDSSGHKLRGRQPMTPFPDGWFD